MKQLCLGLVGRNDTANAKLTTWIKCSREDDVRALNAGELVEDGPRGVAETRPLLPLLEGFPKDVGEEADEDVGLDSLLLLMPDGADGELGLLDPEGRLCLGELDVGLPEDLCVPVVDVGAEYVAALA